MTENQGMHRTFADLHEHPPSANAYLEALRRVWSEPGSRELDLKILAAQIAKGGVITQLELGEAIGYVPTAVNIPYGKLGRRIGEALGYRKLKDEGTHLFTAISTARWLNETQCWQWRLRPQLTRALRKFEWTAGLFEKSR